MPSHLSILESAIADVGYWNWWTANLPATFQVEFGGVQLWNPPTGKGKPPSDLLALCFRKPRLICFITLSSSIKPDWPDKLQRDELEPFSVDHGKLTLTSIKACKDIVARAKQIRSLVGTPGDKPSPKRGEAFIGFECRSVGLVVAAESMSILSHHGEMDETGVIAAHEKWWEYWKEYWDRRDTDDPMPRDYACEVTIPAG